MNIIYPLRFCLVFSHSLAFSKLNCLRNQRKNGGQSFEADDMYTITHFVVVVDHFKASTVALPLSFQPQVSTPRRLSPYVSSPLVISRSYDLVFACESFYFYLFFGLLMVSFNEELEQRRATPRGASQGVLR